MHPMRFAYFKAGEIITLCLLGIFVFFIFFSFSQAHTILDNEDFSQKAIKEIYLREREFFEKDGAFVELEELIAISPVLGKFKTYPKQMKDYDSQELASDGKYFYLLKLERAEPQTALLDGDLTKRTVLGFQCICWPRHFGSTGETCYYVDDGGFFSVSPNTFGELDGIKKHTTFPPDMKPAAGAVRLSREDKAAQWFRLSDLGRSNPLPDPFD